MQLAAAVYGIKYVGTVNFTAHDIVYGRPRSFRYGYLRNLRRQGVDHYICFESLRERSSVIAFQRNDRPDIGGTPFILF